MARFVGAVIVVVLFGACGSSSVPGGSTSPGALPSSLPSPAATSSAAPTVEPSTPPASVDVEGRLFLGGLTGDQEHYSVIADGERRDLFEAEGCHPCMAVSPDGRFVARPFIAPGDQFSAAVYDVVADRTTELEVPDGFDALGPGAISPDGERFMRHGWSDADPAVNGIYTSRLDGSDVRLVEAITDGRGRDPMWWSPDGASLLVWSEDPSRITERHLGDLYVLPADGGASRQLNPPGSSVQAIIRHGTAASFAPDGKHVAFVALQTEDPGRSAVFVVDVAGDTAQQITDWVPGSTSALWSPSGDWILVDHEGEDGRIFGLRSPDRMNERALWTSKPDDLACCPTWSPDGTRILFQRGAPGARQFWVMDTDGDVQGRYDAVEPGDWMWYVWTGA
jgi:Tol biopolymer transport system component